MCILNIYNTEIFYINKLFGQLDASWKGEVIVESLTHPIHSFKKQV